MSDCRFGVSPVNYPDPGSYLNETCVYLLLEIRHALGNGRTPSK